MIDRVQRDNTVITQIVSALCSGVALKAAAAHSEAADAGRPLFVTGVIISHGL